MLKARRAFLVAFTLGVACSLITMFSTALTLSADEERSEATAELLGLSFFRATRVIENGTSSVSLRPGIGVLIVLVVLPSLAAILTYALNRAR